MDVDPGVEDEVRAGGAHAGQVGGLLRRVAERPAAGGMVGVLDVAADRPGGQEPPGQLRGLEAVARLEVGGHRDARHGGDDPADGGENLVDGVLPVVAAEGAGEPAARRGHGRQAGGGDDPGARGVPGVEQQERVAGDVDAAGGRRAGMRRPYVTGPRGPIT